MNHSITPASSFLLLALLSGAARAQIGSLILPSADPRSVVVINGNHVVVGERSLGHQHYIDVSNPALPSLSVTLDPPFYDQWFDAEYTPDFGGRLFTGHRFGGLNMIDTSNPLAPVVAATDPAATYHFRGLRYRNFSGQSLLYYAEVNMGLAVYSVGANSLTRVWTDFNHTINDANGLEVVGNHLYLFGTPYVQPGRRELKTYDLTNPAAPALVDLRTNFGVIAAAQGHCQLRATGFGTHILASRQRDGLDLIDLSNPAAPVSTTLIPPLQDVVCWGSFSYPNSTISFVYGMLITGTVRTGWWYSFHVIPGFGIVPIDGGLAPIEVHDMAVDTTTGRTFVTGIDWSTNQGVLRIY